MMDLDLAVLSLSLPTRNALRRQGINTVAQLCAQSRQDLLGLRSLGPRRLGEIEAALRSIDLALGGEPDAVASLPDIVVRPPALVVDREPAFGHRLAVLLDASGFSVRTARSLDRALAVAETERPVLVVFTAPRSLATARRLIRALRARSGGRLLVLGSWQIPSPQLTSILGADATLPRPFEPGDLLACLQSLGLPGGGNRRSAIGPQPAGPARDSHPLPSGRISAPAWEDGAPPGLLFL